MSPGQGPDRRLSLGLFHALGRVERSSHHYIARILHDWLDAGALDGACLKFVTLY
jgi:hypothetical protein